MLCVSPLVRSIQVRREKISQRMKLLQDLVPGCNKVTEEKHSSFASSPTCLLLELLGVLRLETGKCLLVSGGWKGCHARWNHKLCAVVATASRGICPVSNSQMQNDCETAAFADLERSKRGRAPSEPLPFTSILQFLSMKLATVNPQLDFNNLPNLLAKDVRASLCDLITTFVSSLIVPIIQFPTYLVFPIFSLIRCTSHAARYRAHIFH